VQVLIGSYNGNYSRRQLWINVGSFSGFLIGAPLYTLIMWPGRQTLGLAVLGMMCLLEILYLFLFLTPWRVELTADEFRLHMALRTRVFPLSRVQSIRRGARGRVYFKIDGRRRELWIDARPGRLGTLAGDIKAAAPHVTIVPPGL
jgi:hypothetical protein